MLLSVIIPYRATADLPHIAERIAEKSHLKSNEEMEFIFVDSGSTYRAEELRQKIEQNNIYVKLDTEGKIFSPGQTRNAGIRVASGDVLTFMDADYDWEDEMFGEIIKLIKAKRIDRNKNEFFIIPCIFLTENGTAELKDLPKDERRSLVMNDLVYGKNKYVQFLGIVSSSIVVNRAKYLSLGGNREEMFGHGFEDFESLYRLISSSGKVEGLPDNLCDFNSSWQGTKYEGHRAYLSLMARETLAQGIFMLHNWHKKMPKEFKETTNINFEKFTKYITDFEKNINMPMPLIPKNAQANVLLILSDGYYSLEWYRDLLPYIGKPFLLPDCSFLSDGVFDSNKFKETCEYNKIDMVLMTNPYRNNSTRDIYNYIRQNNFKYFCMERGALPDSWIFSDGFNTDSTSFSEEKWNHPLTEDEKNRTEQYIRDVLRGANFLEKQGVRQGSNALKTDLGLRTEKILFVPLQNREDTTIRYFAGNAISVERFLDNLSKLAALIEHLGWKIVCKKHPLDNDYKLPDNLVTAPNDANIMDLLEMAHAVALINSGVGVYAMMMEKPCFVFGEAFYQQEGLNCRAESGQEIVTHIKRALPVVDKDKMLRFIHYLINDIYSFGHATTHTRVNKNGTTMTCTDRIDFYQINFDGRRIEFDSVKPEPLKKHGMAFDQFRYDLNHSLNINSALKTGGGSLNLITYPRGSSGKNFGLNRLSHDLKVANFQQNPSNEKMGFFAKLIKPKSTIPQKLSDRDTSKIMETFKSQGVDAAFALLDKIAPYPHLQADAYTSMAKSVLKTDIKLATELAYGAWRLHPRPYRQKWLAFRLYEAGEIESSIILLESLPEDTPLSVAEREKMKAIFSHKHKYSSNNQSSSSHL